MRKVANKIQPGIIAEVAGSYRRGKSSSGDIDVIFCTATRPFLRKLVDALHQDGLLTDDLTSGASRASDDFGPESYMGVYRLTPHLPYRRIDLKCYIPEQYAFALLSFTGNAYVA